MEEKMRQLVLALVLLVLPVTAQAGHLSKGIVLFDGERIACTAFNVGERDDQIIAFTAGHCLHRGQELDTVLGTPKPGGGIYRPANIIDLGTQQSLGKMTVIAVFGDLGIISYPKPTEGPYYILATAPFPRVEQREYMLACGVILPDDPVQALCFPGVWADETYFMDGRTFHVAVVPVRPGMSGGPVFDKRGYAVGIYSLRITEGLSGITPVDPGLPFLKTKKETR